MLVHYYYILHCTYPDGEGMLPVKEEAEGRKDDNDDDQQSIPTRTFPKLLERFIQLSSYHNYEHTRDSEGGGGSRPNKIFYFSDYFSFIQDSNS